MIYTFLSFLNLGRGGSDSESTSGADESNPQHFQEDIKSLSSEKTLNNSDLKVIETESSQTKPQ